MRGFWVTKKETCDILKKNGPAYVGREQEWLKITAGDVLGSTQGRYFRETPKKEIVLDNAELSFEIQMFDDSVIFEQLTLSRDGYLYETIIGARASGKYQRCS